MHPTNQDPTDRETGRHRPSTLEMHLWRDGNEPGQLIPLLQKAQEEFGYIPEHAIRTISTVTRIPESEIFGVITFYKQFRLKPLGRYLIRLCDGTACHVNDAKTLMTLVKEELGLDTDDTTSDGLFTLTPVACLGCCSLAPVIMINDETFGRLTPPKVRQILKEFRQRAAADAAPAGAVPAKGGTKA